MADEGKGEGRVVKAKRETGYYWVRLNPVISDGWEIAHYSAAWRSWQIHGKTNDYKDDGTWILEVVEKQITRNGADNQS